MLHFVATFLDLSLRDFMFVKNTADRDGFFEQIKSCILSLAREDEDKSLLTTTGMRAEQSAPAPVSLVLPTSAQLAASAVGGSDSAGPGPTKKAKRNPFDWFQHSTTVTAAG